MSGNERSYDAPLVGVGLRGNIGAITWTAKADLGGAGVNTGTVPSKMRRCEKTALALVRALE